MLYLFFQMSLWLLLSFVLGILCGALICWFCCKKKSQTNSDHKSTFLSETNATTITPQISQPRAHQTVEKKTLRPTETENPKPESTVIKDSWKPTLYTSPPDDIDDLKRIKGIGLKLEQTLNELGIYQFRQIAQFTHENSLWVDHHMTFPGRIKREKWISQAQELAGGGETEFSKRVDKGDIDYKK